jgi:hypothetical protein
LPNQLLFSRPRLLDGRGPAQKPNPRRLRTSQRWIIQVLARIAVAASCTSSAAAFDLGHVRTTDLMGPHDVHADTHSLRR